MEEHTPGPWRVEKVAFASDQTNKRIIEAPDGGNIAEVWEYMSRECPHGPSIANARLIATAPDLLAACEAALAWLDWLEGVDDEPSLPGENHLHMVLCAAIAKARGQADD